MIGEGSPKAEQVTCADCDEKTVMFLALMDTIGGTRELKKKGLKKRHNLANEDQKSFLRLSYYRKIVKNRAIWNMKCCNVTTSYNIDESLSVHEGF